MFGWKSATAADQAASSFSQRSSLFRGNPGCRIAVKASSTLPLAAIARDRPIILLEILSGTHEDPAAYTAAICENFGYDAFIVQRGEKIAALPAIAALGKNASWGTDIESRNVLFLPR